MPEQEVVRDAGGLVQRQPVPRGVLAEDVAEREVLERLVERAPHPDPVAEARRDGVRELGEPRRGVA